MRVSRFKNSLIATHTHPNFFQTRLRSGPDFFNHNSDRVEKKCGAIAIGPENVWPHNPISWPARAVREAGILRALTSGVHHRRAPHVPDWCVMRYSNQKRWCRMWANPVLVTLSPRALPFKSVKDLLLCEINGLGYGECPAENVIDNRISPYLQPNSTIFYDGDECLEKRDVERGYRDDNIGATVCGDLNPGCVPRGDLLSRSPSRK